MKQLVEIVPYSSDWPRRFGELARAFRTALGDIAVRIDHIGSTAVPELAAKPIVDIQISVQSFDPLDAYRLPLQQLGYVFRADNADRVRLCRDRRKLAIGSSRKPRRNASLLEQQLVDHRLRGGPALHAEIGGARRTQATG